MVLAIFLGAASPSNQTAQTSGNSQQQQQHAASEHHAAGQPNQKPAPPPFVVEIVQSADQRPIAVEIEDKTRWYARPDVWVAVFTALLFVATTGLWIVTAFLWKETRKAVQDSSTLVADEKARSERELRAYIFIHDTEVERKASPNFRPGKPNVMQTSGRVSYRYMNMGNTPAKNVRIAARALMIDQGEPFNLSDVGELRSVGPIGPKYALSNNVQIMLSDNGVMVEFKHGCDLMHHVNDGKEVHLFGRIEYSDEFGANRWTRFHSYLSGEVGSDLVMHTHKDGNDYG